MKKIYCCDGDEEIFLFETKTYNSIVLFNAKDLVFETRISGSNAQKLAAESK